MSWTSRKFWAMWVFEALFVKMRFENLLTGEQFVSLTTILIIAYFAANAAGKFGHEFTK